MKRIRAALAALPFVAASLLATTPSAATPAPVTLCPLETLLVQRIQIGDQVAAAKFGTDKPIDDPAREQQELADVRQRSAALGIDPAAAARIFADQIEASKVVQRGLFARWTANPAQAPTTRPDLNKIRPVLDAITTTLLTRLQQTEGLRGPTVRCGVELVGSSAIAATQAHLDVLHLRALAVADRSVCR